MACSWPTHLAAVTVGGASAACALTFTAGTWADAISSFAAFWKSTRLSPSAVMPA